MNSRGGSKCHRPQYRNKPHHGEADHEETGKVLSMYQDILVGNWI